MACLALISKSPCVTLRGLSVLAASLSAATRHSSTSLPQLSTLTPWTLLNSTFWPCKSPDTWMKINLHKSNTHFHSKYHLSLLFWFVNIPCHFLPCKASLHHLSQTSSASCLSPFPLVLNITAPFILQPFKQPGFLLTTQRISSLIIHTHTHSFFFTQIFDIVLTQPCL